MWYLLCMVRDLETLEILDARHRLLGHEMAHPDVVDAEEADPALRDHVVDLLEHRSAQDRDHVILVSEQERHVEELELRHEVGETAHSRGSDVEAPVSTCLIISTSPPSCMFGNTSSFAFPPVALSRCSPIMCSPRSMGSPAFWECPALMTMSAAPTVAGDSPAPRPSARLRPLSAVYAWDSLLQVTTWVARRRFERGPVDRGLAKRSGRPGVRPEVLEHALQRVARPRGEGAGGRARIARRHSDHLHPRAGGGHVEVAPRWRRAGERAGDRPHGRRRDHPPSRCGDRHLPESLGTMCAADRDVAVRPKDHRVPGVVSGEDRDPPPVRRAISRTRVTSPLDSLM